MQLNQWHLHVIAYKSGSMRSFPDTETNRERGEGIRQSWPKFGHPREGRDRPLSSVGVKEAESGGKLRLLRRPFHPDVQRPPRPIAS